MVKPFGPFKLGIYSKCIWSRFTLQIAFLEECLNIKLLSFWKQTHIQTTEAPGIGSEIYLKSERILQNWKAVMKSFICLLKRKKVQRPEPTFEWTNSSNKFYTRDKHALIENFNKLRKSSLQGWGLDEKRDKSLLNITKNEKSMETNKARLIKVTRHDQDYPICFRQ